MSDTPHVDWVTVFESGTDYEADLVRDRLDDAGIPAIVLTQRDHAFNLTVGDLAVVQVLVPPQQADEALALLNAEAISDEALERAALESDPNAPDAHDAHGEARLDSGPDSMDFGAPDDEA
jgi:hypothetical protein